MKWLYLGTPPPPQTHTHRHTHIYFNTGLQLKTLTFLPSPFHLCFIELTNFSLIKAGKEGRKEGKDKRKEREKEPRRWYRRKLTVLSKEFYKERILHNWYREVVNIGWWCWAFSSKQARELPSARVNILPLLSFKQLRLSVIWNFSLFIQHLLSSREFRFIEKCIKSQLLITVK